MYNIYTIYVQYVYNICTIYVQYMHNVYTTILMYFRVGMVEGGCGPPFKLSNIEQNSVLRWVGLFNNISIVLRADIEDITNHKSMF